LHGWRPITFGWQVKRFPEHALKSGIFCVHTARRRYLRRIGGGLGRRGGNNIKHARFQSLIYRGRVAECL
jgi:hypothetical protein